MSSFVEVLFQKSYSISLTSIKSWLLKFYLSLNLEELLEQLEQLSYPNSNHPHLMRLVLQMMSELKKLLLKSLLSSEEIQLTANYRQLFLEEAQLTSLKILKELLTMPSMSSDHSSDILISFLEQAALKSYFLFYLDP